MAEYKFSVRTLGGRQQRSVRYQMEDIHRHMGSNFSGMGYWRLYIVSTYGWRASANESHDHHSLLADAWRESTGRFQDLS
eukprot:SAG31_NODE_42_length_31262_cov_46.416231_21_plen_80_part_00